ncbi:deoxyuridine 5'-triphosphate nucleotidohydrolase [Sinorhizobium sp. LM21]|uniref:dUTP diphosphatase n=1 Tax=Sinorhizobium sp. LM21 TaxID=1449788 RepID=UPI0005D8705A|nr:dUTP diphosphatase [Sinorhizobium sp. LM21]AJW30156.1 deoxyuridine 5'-triphosphate nucleotidohydrolase [Sinorhizobium sp. LM21]OWZ90496.1 deoxyuridine 5'-triphosphate nucleotidohydrolase [Sinorhizobium sp. LM21]
MTEAQQIRIQLLHPEAKVPTYGSEEAAGADLHAVLQNESVFILPGERMIIPTGVAIELNPGTEAQVRPRSGLAAKHGLTVLNTPGTVDSDYRGEIKVILFNASPIAYELKNGERIAQMVIAPVIRGVFTIAESLDDTARGENGFGSTGK